MKMKAALFLEPNQPLQIAEVDLDRPTGREVLIRTAASGVCHSDLHSIDGSSRTIAPCILGHESAGVVEEVGEQVTYLKPGDHVTTCISAFCGACEYCLSGHPNLCRDPSVRPVGKATPVRAMWNGTRVARQGGLGGYAEYMIVHEASTVRIPEDTPFPVAAILGCGVTTGLGAAFRTAGVEPGSSVAVFGVGGVGLGTLQGARIAGARTIIAVDLLPPKLQTATELGATHVINGREENAVERIREISDGGVDYAFDCIGLKQVAEDAFAALRNGGTATVVGVLNGKLELDGRMLMTERKMQGCSMGSNRFRVDIPKYIDLYRQGRLRLDEMVTRTGPLEMVNEAFELMKAGTGTRTVLVF